MRQGIPVRGDLRQARAASGFALLAWVAWSGGEVGGLTLLELACGSGYWTRVAATTAKAILATDCNPSSLELARSKNLGPHVTFARADAFALPARDCLFDGGMAHFLVVASIRGRSAAVPDALRLQTAQPSQAAHDRQHLYGWLDADFAAGSCGQHLSAAAACKRRRLRNPEELRHR